MKLIVAFLIYIKFLLISNALEIHLDVNLENSFNGPENMGVGMVVKFN